VVRVERREGTMSVAIRTADRATDADPALAAPTTSKRRFFYHYLEMVVVMMLSMALLGGLASGILTVLGSSNLLDLDGLVAFGMTVNMTIGMTLWMRLRRHGWASTLEMDAAMIVPFGVFIGPYWAGLLSGDGLLGLEHVLMLPLMFLVMLRRYDEYAHAHGRHRSGHEGGATGAGRWRR
jgi:flagellar biosynthetic protein FliP